MSDCLEILLVEDNRADARWLEIMLSRTGARYRLNVVDTGEAALEYLLRHDRNACAPLPLPGLVLLDINLAGCLDGIEVFERMRDHEELSRVPVFFVTGSEMERPDIIRRYNLRDNCYLTKPVDARKLAAAMACHDPLSEFAVQVQAPRAMVRAGATA
jgi:CheY-like chemotaxis protein